MSVALLTNAEVLAHLRMEIDEEPTDIDDIEMKMAAASIAIVKYLGEGADFLDETGNCVPADVPEDIKIAAMILVGYLYRVRDENKDGDFTQGYLPDPVVSFLWPYRIPPLG